MPDDRRLHITYPIGAGEHFSLSPYPSEIFYNKPDLFFNATANTKNDNFPDEYIFVSEWWGMSSRFIPVHYS